MHLECVSNSDVGVRFGIVNEIDKLVTIIITYIYICIHIYIDVCIMYVYRLIHALIVCVRVFVIFSYLVV